MLHKSDPRWVRVGWEIETEVCDAGEAMMAPASHLSSEKLSGFVVRSRGAAVREIFARTGVDKDFGPVILVGAGGFQVEFCKDVAVWLAPADERSARQALTSKQTANRLAASVVRVLRILAGARLVLFRSSLSILPMTFPRVGRIPCLPGGQGYGALDGVGVRRQDKGGVS